ncbi:MAG: CocE/NonD family hydrolase [Chloroflexi bacterium]|nr:CocE/NonD family hydrolase [Chloroflexota bacterium]
MVATDFYQVRILYNIRISTRDGIELSANLWLPVPKTEGETFPAILEMIPYRKDDWRYNSDHQHGTYFAQRGFAFCRLDVRGTGSSEGIAYDEYTREETQDGYDTVEWLAAQPWCNGKVGMWGISYGGFTSIQVAMLQPPHLKAIIPMYATDDRYTDDVHYLGGCLTVSELAQYAVSMVGMNAMPPKLEYAGAKWAEQWKERLKKTPPWLIEWLQQQTDGPYWRNGSLAPDYTGIKCAVFNIGGWMDEYVNSVLRMQERCTQATGVKGLIGNWVHSYPDSAYPGPNLDHLHEMVRFFEYWLNGIDNGVMNEPPLTLFRYEHTAPEAFPSKFNGQWISANTFPVEGTQPHTLYLGDATLSNLQAERPVSNLDHYPHRPTHGTHAALCWGAGYGPNGLARDLRLEEAIIPTYTSEPLDEPLDVIGFPEAVLYLSCSAPVATVVVRLADVAPDGSVFQVTAGVLNLTHRDSHINPEPLTPNTVYEIKVQLRSTAYRFLPGHRIRLSLASAYWPVIWPSPYKSDNYLHRGSATLSRLILPAVSLNAPRLQPPSFKTTPPELVEVGGGTDAPPVWQIVEDVINQTMTVNVYEGGTAVLPDGRSLFASERIEMATHQIDPLKTRMFNEVVYRLEESGYQIEIHSSGSVRCTETEFIMDIQLRVDLNGNLFFHKSWLKSLPRRLV